jgi:FixJ family two-component response regulator
MKPDAAGRNHQTKVSATPSSRSAGQEVDNSHFDVPVIFITGRGDVFTAVQAMKAGAVEVLVKPCSDDVLPARVESMEMPKAHQE